MTFGRYKSVRRVLGTTLLLVGLSLVLSPELFAEEAPEQESQSSEEPTADSSEDTQTKSKPQQAILNEEVARDAIPEETMLDARENAEDWLEESPELPIIQNFNEDLHDELRALSCRRGEKNLSECKRSEREQRLRKAGQMAVYWEGTHLIFPSAWLVNLERRFGDKFAWSVGFGRSRFTGLMGVEAKAWGPRTQIHRFVGSDTSMFEVAAGLAPYTNTNGVRSYHVSPTVHFGYRFQALHYGLVVRVGATWAHVYGFGPSLSLGLSF
jgi:hypothetical protein